MIVLRCGVHNIIIAVMTKKKFFKTSKKRLRVINMQARSSKAICKDEARFPDEF